MEPKGEIFVGEKLPFEVEGAADDRSLSRKLMEETTPFFRQGNLMQPNKIIDNGRLSH